VASAGRTTRRVELPTRLGLPSTRGLHPRSGHVPMALLAQVDEVVR
jgi:hypothetical protein